MALFSIGHSNLPAEKFVALLKAHGVTLLADVRSKPFSRFNPQFNRGALVASLPLVGVAYAWYPVLGGLENVAVDSPEFVAAMDELIANTQNVCLMCSERDPQDCHRQTKLGTWAARERGVILTHIVAGGVLRQVQEPRQSGLFE